MREQPPKNNSSHIRPGTTIIGDFCGVNSRSAALSQGYQLHTLNLNFVDPNTVDHTQITGSHWQLFKALAKRNYGMKK